MNTGEIDNVLKSHPVTRFFALPTCASDQLPETVPEKPFVGVVNHDPISKPGSHWTAYVVLDSKTDAEYFDSYGLPPTEPIADFLMKHSTGVLWNRYAGPALGIGEVGDRLGPRRSGGARIDGDQQVPSPPLPSS